MQTDIPEPRRRMGAATACLEKEAVSEDGAVPMPLGSERTMEQVIARQLRRMIVDGVLAPGERLRYRELAAQFDVSATPVRIALRELANEGLVESKAHEGARVSALSAEALEELYATRIGIEAWLARYGAPRLSPDDLKKMAALLSRAVAAFEADDREALVAAAWGARRECFIAARRPRLLEVADRLFERSARYNRLTLNIPQRLEETYAFLVRFEEACRDRDGRAASQVVADTLERAAEYILTHRMEPPAGH